MTVTSVTRQKLLPAFGAHRSNTCKVLSSPVAGTNIAVGRDYLEQIVVGPGIQGIGQLLAELGAVLVLVFLVRVAFTVPTTLGLFIAIPGRKSSLFSATSRVEASSVNLGSSSTSSTLIQTTLSFLSSSSGWG